MNLLQCSDCSGKLSPELDEVTGELVGFVCDECQNFFDDVQLDDEDD